MQQKRFIISSTSSQVVLLQRTSEWERKKRVKPTDF